MEFIHFFCHDTEFNRVLIVSLLSCHLFLDGRVYIFGKMQKTDEMSKPNRKPESGFVASVGDIWFVHFSHQNNDQYIGATTCPASHIMTQRPEFFYLVLFLFLKANCTDVFFVFFLFAGTEDA